VTDGTSFWVVDGSKLKVFKYTLSGSLLGSWSIDPADTSPTGITINPNNPSDIWIVDNGTDKVYQYVGAASRTSGSQNAAATFALAAGNTNPQGIADPPTQVTLLTPTADGPTPNQPSVAALNAVYSAGPSADADVPTLTSRDAVFALLGREALSSPGGPNDDLPAGGAFTPLLDSLGPIADLAWTAPGALRGQNTSDLLTLLTPTSSQRVRSDGSAMGLRGHTLAGEDSEVSVTAMNLSSGGLANESAAEE
jgi:hypothetical protein